LACFLTLSSLTTPCALIGLISCVCPAVEVDEVYVVAGHKGNPAAVAKKAARGDGGGSRAHPAVARWQKRSRRSLA
jgi:hypothetical protein